ncbi:hypothetical protein BpHYR1_030338 [Brachionus plicatilis]|uniref:Uncharacterized protein n=1 Tax=Brachionus plicatilis TaxID=10195 RepID=A0A3M7PK02_BRAPC|nr:hypothetical protein BpHYR1_030338 [Brachionus plicatilis]
MDKKKINHFDVNLVSPLTLLSLSESYFKYCFIYECSILIKIVESFNLTKYVIKKKTISDLASKTIMLSSNGSSSCVDSSNKSSRFFSVSKHLLKFLSQPKPYFSQIQLLPCPAL